MDYHLVIGLEVHVQLLTRSKLFCGCSTKFGQPPNSATCPVCIGLPGTLPVMNREAFNLSLKAALALNCQIRSFTKWDRKNYYYPDLPKNYQISQYDLPFSHDGWLAIETSAGPRRIGIIRAHLEEDAGKMLHDEAGSGKDSLVDLNRTGTPLLEIVSEPDLETPEEAKAYLEEIRLLLREIGVSDCEMQEGSLRCDANVNLHIPQADGTFVATPLIEVKNLNTFRGVERAMKYEADRQFQEFQRKFGGTWDVDRSKARMFKDRTTYAIVEIKEGRRVPVSKATAGWDDRRERTDIQRRKEEASDYRYFPEPDLAPIHVDATMLEAAKSALGELPSAQKARLQSQYGLAEYEANVLAKQGRKTVAYFEAVVAEGGDAKESSNWVLNDLMQTLNERKLEIHECPMTASQLAGLVKAVKTMGLNKQRAREVYAEMLASETSASEAIGKLGIKVVGDENQLLEIVQRAIANNAKAVADFKKGKVKAADAIKGAVMRETKGMAKMELVQQLVMRELEKA